MSVDQRGEDASVFLSLTWEHGTAEEQQGELRGRPGRTGDGRSSGEMVAKATYGVKLLCEFGEKKQGACHHSDRMRRRG